MKRMYPSNPHQTNEASTFMVGMVWAGNSLTINGQAAHVSDKGYFTVHLPLHFGENRFQFEEHGPANADQVKRRNEMLVVHRHWPLGIKLGQKVEDPAAFDSSHGLFAAGFDVLPNVPVAYVTGFNGFTLQLACVAHPEANVTVTILGLVDQPVVLSAPQQTNGLYVENRTHLFQSGYQRDALIRAMDWHQAEIVLPADATPGVYSVCYEARLPSGQIERNTARGKITVWPEAVPMRVQPKSEMPHAMIPPKAVCRLAPGEDAQRQTPQPIGVIVSVVGEYGDWCQVLPLSNRVLDISSAPACSFWIRREELLTANLNAAETTAVMGLPQRLPDDLKHREDVWLKLPIERIRSDVPEESLSSECLPLVSVTTAPGKILLTFHGTAVTPELLADSRAAYLASLLDHRLKAIDVWPLHGKTAHIDSQLAGACVELSVSRLCGVEYFYRDNALVLQIIRLPQDLEQVTVVLDPGHGGAENGTIGPNGLPEQTQNLIVARALLPALQEVGFGHVFLTRSQSQNVSLQARHEFAVDAGAHIVISLHHNALPDGRNPLEHRGACSFYYHDQSRPLAEAMQQALVAVGQRDYGTLYESFYMTRIQQALSSLVELGFFTHPDEFTHITTPEFVAQATQSMASALRQFCEKFE